MCNVRITLSFFYISQSVLNNSHLFGDNNDMNIKNNTLYFKNAFKTLTGISVPRVVTYMTGQVILFIIANTNSTLVHFFLRKNYLFTLVCLKTSNMAWISCDHTVQLYWTIVFNLFLKLAIYFEIKKIKLVMSHIDWHGFE